MNKAEEKALKAYPILFSERNGYDQTMKLKRVAYELGYKQAEKDIKEQMIKDAVEGIVTTRSMAGNIVTAHLDWRYRNNEIVKLIIIKEEQKEG